MNRRQLYYSGSLALATIVAETYAGISLNQGFYRIGTGLGQAFILAVIAWVVFGVGDKNNETKAVEARPFIIAGLFAWAVSSSAFRLLYGSFGPSPMTIVAPMVIVGFVSYLAGVKGGIGKKSAANEIR